MITLYEYEIPAITDFAAPVSVVNLKKPGVRSLVYLEPVHLEHLCTAPVDLQLSPGSTYSIMPTSWCLLKSSFLLETPQISCFMRNPAVNL
jgi:hypothetical protein